MSQKCTVCFVSRHPSQFKKFVTCKTKPCNTVCNFCFTQYLKSDFTANPTNHLACFACSEPLDKDKVLQLLVKSPDDRRHYNYCLERYMSRQSGAQACVFADCKNMHVQMIDGRLSVCQWCTRQACVDCGVPEHLGESCQQYQTRMTREHDREESATSMALAQGYIGREEVGQEGRMRTRQEHPLPCPSCGIWIERFGGCLRMRCPICSLDFCGTCAAPYLGMDSVPVKGNKAHHPDCPYAKRKVEDRRFKPALPARETEIESEDHARVKQEQGALKDTASPLSDHLD